MPFFISCSDKWKKGDLCWGHLLLEVGKRLSGNLHFLKYVVTDFYQVNAIGGNDVFADRLWDIAFADNQTATHVVNLNGEAFCIGNDNLIIIAVYIYIGEVSIVYTNHDLEDSGENTILFHSDGTRVIRITIVPAYKYIIGECRSGNLNFWTTYPNYDLYCSYYIDGEWTTPEKLGGGINRDDSWESQPSLSSDGEVLFFASDRPGGFGGSDIWYSRKNAEGEWQKPVNLGKTINTAGNERSPFLHTDSKTLYFSSAGHDGMGGMDVFYSKMDGQGRWTTPINIGHPINTERDEVDFFVSLDGKTGYFSSDQYNEEGILIGGGVGTRQSNVSWDIFQFELYEDARPHSMVI